MAYRLTIKKTRNMTAVDETFDSIEDASRNYCQLRDLSGEGMSTFHNGRLVDLADGTVYRISYNGHVWKGEERGLCQGDELMRFDVYNAHGLYEANCSIDRVNEMTGWGDHEDWIAKDGYSNDYVDVFPVCIVPHGAGLHPEGKAHIKANGEK